MADRSCVAIIEDDQILMVHQTYRGRTFWTLPGGSIEPGETPQAASIREAQEETGLTVEIIRLLRQTPRATSDGTYYCYLGKVLRGQAALGHDPELEPDSQELHAIRWFSIEQVREHPEIVNIIAVLT